MTAYNHRYPLTACPECGMGILGITCEEPLRPGTSVPTLCPTCGHLLEYHMRPNGDVAALKMPYDWLHEFSDDDRRQFRERQEQHHERKGAWG